MTAISDFIFANSNQDYFGSASPFGDPRDVFIDGVVEGSNSTTLTTVQVNNHLIGTQGNNYLSAYNVTANELDTLTGGAGADTFVAGDTLGIHYTGSAIAFVTDYSFAQGDVLQLSRSGSAGYTYDQGNYGLGTQVDDIVVSYNGDPVAALVDTTQFRWTYV